MNKIYTLLILFSILACKSKTENIDKPDFTFNRVVISNSLSNNYKWYYYDSINKPNSGFIVKGDSIKMDFHFYTTGNIKSFIEELDNYKIDTLYDKYYYITHSEEIKPTKYNFTGVLLEKNTESQSKFFDGFQQFILFLNTNKNVTLNQEEISYFKNFLNQRTKK